MASVGIIKYTPNILLSRFMIMQASCNVLLIGPVLKAFCRIDQYSADNDISMNTVKTNIAFENAQLFTTKEPFQVGIFKMSTVKLHD